MKESIRTRGVSANGATAATHSIKIAVTAIADQVCRDVGGSVANTTSISSVSLRAIIVPRAAAMARRMIWLYAYQHSRYATICLVAGQSAYRLPTRIVGYWTMIGDRSTTMSALGRSC